jgi:hypothetical protein
MGSSVRTTLMLLLCSIGISLIGCASAPVQEMSITRQAIAAAEDAGATATAGGDGRGAPLMATEGKAQRHNYRGARMDATNARLKAGSAGSRTQRNNDGPDLSALLRERPRAGGHFRATPQPVHASSASQPRRNLMTVASKCSRAATGRRRILRVVMERAAQSARDRRRIEAMTVDHRKALRGLTLRAMALAPAADQALYHLRLRRSSTRSG